jgi:hypothetical protein
MNENNVQILGSPLGMYSLLRGEFIISILKDDGSLDLNKLNNMVAAIANMGATGIRDFFWIDTEEAYKRISPFWRKDDGSFEFNGRYFDHQREIATLCNRYGVRYYLSIFDHCGTKRKKTEGTGVWQWNPWRFFNDFFYGNDAADMRHRFIDRILEAFKGLDTGIEVCNEPKSGAGDFLGDTFVYLVRNGYTPENIIIGIDYHLKEKDGAYGNDYRTLRNAAIRGLEDENWDQWLKSRCISPVHNASAEEIDHLWRGEAGPGGTRRILYSQDGVQNPRPDRNTMFKVAKKVLEMKTEAREKGKVLFEVVYGKTSSDPLDAIAGVSEAHNSIFGTFGRFPLPLPLPEQNGPVTPPPDPINTAIVEAGYLGILGRQADPGGRDGYVNFLRGGGTILEFCRKLMDSEEYRTYRAGLPVEQLATQLYKGILKRNPDSDGMAHTLGMIRNSQFAERTAGMLDSMEFKSRFG